MAYQRFVALLVSGVLVVLVGCRPKGRLMSDEEEDLVGARRAGAATFNRLVEEATTKLLAHESAADRGLAKKKVAFIDIENRSVEELGDFKEQIYQVIDTVIVTSRRYDPISRRYIDAGLRESGMRPDQLIVPKYGRAFAEVMETQGQPVDYLLYSTLTSGSTSGVNVRQRDYLLTMELLHVQSGRYHKESTRIRKEYRK